MWNSLPFLIVSLHETGIAWDEIIPLTLIALTVVVGVILVLLSRRMRASDDE